MGACSFSLEDVLSVTTSPDGVPRRGRVSKQDENRELLLALFCSCLSKVLSRCHTQGSRQPGATAEWDLQAHGRARCASRCMAVSVPWVCCDTQTSNLLALPEMSRCHCPTNESVDVGHP